MTLNIIVKNKYELVRCSYNNFYSLTVMSIIFKVVLASKNEIQLVKYFNTSLTYFVLK